MLDIVQIPVLTDNYVYLARAGAAVFVVDPAVSEPILAAAEARGWRITHILNTHWHPDHVGGNAAIQAATGCFIVGPAGEAAKIPGLGQAVRQGDIVDLDGHAAHVIDVPGHTAGHNAYYFPADDALFCGDTLFALGCGRLFEGTADEMWASLAKLTALPDETRVFCAHEYTQSNGRFALSVDGGNPALAQRMAEVNAARAAGLPTVPSTLGLERQTNPFLTADSVESFAERRRAKDVFRG
jgi:hydroxyacylglutathione hydrolase